MSFPLGQKEAWTSDGSINADLQSAQARFDGVFNRAVSVFVAEGPFRT